MVRETVSMLLEFDGHHVETAGSGAEALAAFKLGKFDVIFTDFSMPAMTGGQLASAIKALSPCQPIVLLTAFVERFLSPGQQLVAINSVLGKPIEIEIMRQTITDLMESAA
jgi:CheY-like chemotaxis protein